MPSSSQVLDRIDVTFDHDQAVADAGLLLPATVAARLGLEDTADALVGVGYDPVARSPRSCMPSLPVVTASTMSTCCAPARPSGSSGTR